jgi:hypothetical protein
MSDANQLKEINSMDSKVIDTIFKHYEFKPLTSKQLEYKNNYKQK